ncbi:armadillo-type protein [Durotheca rogersii]|uniref:armadillo-type protein n=1 Tax=Durotheca rogersii TaxID=419775 RepID=UPI00221E6D8D|nr:armadillo-type protein [Durotheca rogersii]KAI5855601.1 armadillo-type protein [Durotheca rogersii]
MIYLIEVNAAMEDIPIPTTLPEVEHLIRELYKPNPAAKIARIQEVLQGLQRSPDGWQLAQGLLSRPDGNVKFFGALTIIVKLNTESLPDEDAVSVLQQLISWLITSLGDGSREFVLRKLCSALVTYFIHYSHTWTKCVRHLLYCLDTQASVPVENVKDGDTIEPAIRALDPGKFLVLTWFATVLAEESEKVDTKSTKYISLHERVLENGRDVVTILSYNSLQGPGGERSHPADSIYCLQAWLLYAQRNPKPRLIQQLQTLVQPVINCLLVDELYEAAVELLTDALANWQSFFLRDHFESLYSVFESQWSRQKYLALLQADFDFDSVQFGLFMLAFGDAQMVEMMDSTNERAQGFLTSLALLLSAEGHPVAEDKIFVPALEFWSAFVENLVDTLYTEPTGKLQWDIPPLSQIMRVVSYSWQKIQYPPLDVYNSWDSTERVGFSEARKDVADYLQSVYTISGKSLVSIFVDFLLQALKSSAWAELEAASFCLGALSDCVSDGTSCDELLTCVFGSPLFDLLLRGQNDIPMRVRQTCLSLIERYSDYFSNHAEFLPGALNLLFNAVGDRHLTVPSSKSIHKLCSSCRSLLTTEVNAFLEQYGSLRSNPEFDSLAEERVVGAIASIIQAVPDHAQKTTAFQRLLILVGVDVNSSLHLCSRGEGFLVDPNDPVIPRAYDIAQHPAAPVSAVEVSLQLAIRALRCLSNIAKGLQAPTDGPIDLDTEDDGFRPSPDVNPTQTHVNIMNTLVQLKETFSSNSEVVDVICSILRAGFSETEPGPFVFPLQMVTEFIINGWQTRIATVVNTASVFVTSLSNGGQKKHAGEILGQLLPWIFNILHQLSGPEQDPELAQYGLEFVQRVMAQRPEILMSQPSNMLEFLFLFALKLLNGSEPLPKLAATEFWTTFITLKTDDPHTQAIVDTAMSYLGPQLSQSLVQNIGGKASRSELDKLSDPLKKLVVQHVGARQWLEAALNDPSFPSDKVSEEDKALFLKKIISLRGQRATSQVVRDFWLACRGSSFAYVS